MKIALAQIAADIGALIAADDFPDRIRPDYLAGAVRDYPSRGGKRLRPALVVWSCGLLGGEVAHARYPAAAVEVYHNWTLVHDDIIDQDAFRRNLPTTHHQLAATMRERFSADPVEAARLGRDFAMLCGDLQQAWANHLLLRSVADGVEPATALRIAVRFQELGNRDLVSGEALDMELALRRIEDVTAAEAREMIGLKTGALLQLAAETGALLAGGTDEEVCKLGTFAMLCGIAFQLRDDYLGIFGDGVKLGKKIGADLREAKPTVLLLTALEKSDAPTRVRLLGFLRREHYDESDIAEVRTLLTACGAAAAVTAEADRLAGQARTLLAAFPAGRFRDCLDAFAAYLVERDK